MLAVLMSGSWRTGSDVAINNLKILEDCGHPFKIFIHTWDQNIATFRTPLETIYAHHWYFSVKEPIYEVPPPIVSVELIKEFYPNAEVLIESFDETNFFERYCFTESQKSVTRYLNTCAMYYGMHQSMIQLISDPDFSNFTHFLKVRPDFMFSKEAVNEIFVNQLVFIGQTIETAKGRVSDQCFGGEIKSSLWAMEGITKLTPIPTQSGFVFPEHVAITGENPLIELVGHMREISDIEISYFPESPPNDMIQRPRVLESSEKMFQTWLVVCARHNLRVLLNRIVGYSQIIFSKLRSLGG
jgi:hypothetical protein